MKEQFQLSPIISRYYYHTTFRQMGFNLSFPHEQRVKRVEIKETPLMRWKTRETRLGI